MLGHVRNEALSSGSQCDRRFGHRPPEVPTMSTVRGAASMPILEVAVPRSNDEEY